MTGVLKCVVPLAGPDFSRALMAFDGQPLVRRALDSRDWARRLAPEDHVFVLREADGAAELEAYVTATWPGCRVVKVTHLTDGAMLSALVGVAALPLDTGPIIVDLADILFKGGVPNAWPRDLGGIVPCFRSHEPQYSYLRFEGDEVVETAEKRVISDCASAGVYLFRDAAVFAAAAAHSLANREALAHQGALFVCPMMNGVVAQGLKVWGVPVANVRPAPREIAA